MQSSQMPDKPESHGNGKRKRKKPYAIEWRFSCISRFRDWSVYQRYETEADRDKALGVLDRKDGVAEYRAV